MKFYIIGAGWYGCYLAYKLKDEHEVLLVDKNNDIFSETSTHNQNRLHLGFHYMRSYNTRNECLNGYKKFIEEFNHLTLPIENNIYVIDKNSTLDFDTIKHILTYEKIPFVIDKNQYSPIIFENNRISGIFWCDEKQILFKSANNFFRSELKDILQLNKTIENIYEDIEKFKPDYVLNCTYGSLIKLYDTQLFNTLLYFEEWCISFLIKSKTTANNAVTVIDGKFFSIYPYDLTKNLFTLTHVEHTPYKKSSLNNTQSVELCEQEVKKLYSLMTSDVKKIILNYDILFEYYGYFTSRKVKKYSGCDDRSCDMHMTSTLSNIKICSFIGGKITGIFNAFTDLNNYLT